jgi:hypothetical protein
MANKRTVDPNAEEASSQIIGIRVTAKQIQQIAALCEARGVKRSTLLRDLVRNAYNSEFSPEPF